MEAQAAYGPGVAVPDYRELAAPVAAWLVGLGFQAVVGPAPDSPHFVNLTALWQAPTGETFELRLAAQRGWALCDCVKVIGPWTYACFAQTQVETLAEVQWLLLRNYAFYRARHASRAALPSAPGLAAAPFEGYPEAPSC